MQNYIIGTDIKCVIPKSGSYLSSLIRTSAKGNFQINKINALLLRGYVKNSKKEKNLNKFDYEKSMLNLVNRINKKLESTGLYRIKSYNGYWYLSEE